MDRLSIVVPCYNEEQVLDITVQELRAVLKKLINKSKISADSFMLFVDDGSKDKTWNILERENNIADDVYAVKLAKNVGHQNALLAGLSVACDISDISVSVDADLQDDISKIEEMVDEYHKGSQIVYGVRSARKTDSFFKRFSAETFYRLINFMGVESVYNHADYRLMSKTAIKELMKYEEVNVYLRGMVPLLGYKTSVVKYERLKRVAGESKYPLKKMISLAFDGITSFSIKPISMIICLGIIVLIICLLAAVYSFVSYFSGTVEKGWTSLILSIWFLGGVQLVCIGVIGEYIGKIYKEVKRRPKFNIELFLDEKKG